MKKTNELLVGASRADQILAKALVELRKLAKHRSQGTLNCVECRRAVYEFVELGINKRKEMLNEKGTF